MKLSIITINMNNKEGLRKTIESVASQTYTDYEFIVIDGKSTDGSVDIIKQYEQNITYWVSEKDSGIYNAMNKGIRQAKGEYLYFLNSGDYLYANISLADMLADNPSTSFICASYKTEQNGTLTDDHANKYKDWRLSLYDLYKGYVCHQSFFIRRDNFEKYGLYDENLRITADWKLFYEAIAVNQAEVLYKDTFLVVYNLEGLSGQVGETAIHQEKYNVCKTLLPAATLERLERLYFLEQNAYIPDIIRSNKWLFNSFRAYCKLGRMFGFVNSK